MYEYKVRSSANSRNNEQQQQEERTILRNTDWSPAFTVAITISFLDPMYGESKHYTITIKDSPEALKIIV